MLMDDDELAPDEPIPIDNLTLQDGTPIPPPETTDTTPCITFNAMQGRASPSTLRFNGFIQEQPVSILVDSGSTHNFLQSRLAKHLKLCVEQATHMSVIVGNGDTLRCEGVCHDVSLRVGEHAFSVDLHLLPIFGADVVLGAEWLSGLGPTTFCFKNLWMSFCHQGTTTRLDGLQHATRPTQMSLTQLKRAHMHGGVSHYFHIQAAHSRPTSHSPPFPDLILPSSLSPSVSEKLHSILRQFANIFTAPHGLPPSRPTDHRIPLIPGASPVTVKPYRYPHFQKNEIERMINSMLADDIITPSTSPFTSPVLLVKKKDGSWRFCVDYRALNAITIKDRFPIPTVDELLDELNGAQVFTRLDLKSGYHQLRLHPADTQKTAFRTHEGHYEFLVMPFGLSNAPASFQAEMNRIFKHLLRRSVLVFFDDILIYSTSWDTHLVHLYEVLTILANHPFYANPGKCDIGRDSIAYLGHIISAQGVMVDSAKVQAVQTWRPPTNLRQLRGFLGLVGYYRRFVRDYASRAANLTNLLRKDAFVWDTKAMDAFIDLKSALTTTPVLALPDFSKAFTLQTDASGVGIGAVLLQNNRPVAYFSNRFIIQTDHQPLKALLTQDIHTPAQEKWIAKLLGYEFEVCYNPGKENKAADALSRLPEHACMALSSVSKPELGILRALRRAYQDDEMSRQLLLDVQANPAAHPNHLLRDGLLLHNGKLLVPHNSALRELILFEYHNTPTSGHPGVARTFARISANFTWPNLRLDVKNYVGRCNTCLQVKSPNTAPPGLLQPLPIPSEVWQDISLDFITHLPLSNGFSAILVVVDRLPRRLTLFPSSLASQQTTSPRFS
ncbi:unnamed protein product [Rhodiola kirilowii]